MAPSSWSTEMLERSTSHSPSRGVTRRLRLKRLIGSAAAALVALAGLQTGWSHDDATPEQARGLVPPPGFVASVWGSVPAPTSIAVGPDTRDPSRERLYASSMDGNIYAMDVGTALGPPSVFASGFRQPLGMASGVSGELFVSDSYAAEGKTWGTVKVLTDTDSDGFADVDEVVVSGLPNGRHNTNGLALGPDARLYIANGNRTDDGIECGPPPVESLECPSPEAFPYSGSILAVDPSRRDQTLDDVAVVAKGFRNIYDLAFHPSLTGTLFTAMNGPDDPAADDVLYSTDVLDGSVDDMGFPSCLYNPHYNPFLLVEVPPHGHDGHGESLEPQDNLNMEVIQRFGRCETSTVTRPLASFGGHVSADGLAFATTAFDDMAGDLFVAEWGNIWGLEDGHVSGHKVVRVDLDASGSVVLDEETGKPSVHEFMTGGAPIDIIFDGSGMIVADFAGAIYRIERVM